jgi:hypothetical protein
MEIISIAEPCALLAELASAFLQGRRGRTSRPALKLAIIPRRFKARYSKDPGVMLLMTAVSTASHAD